MAGRIYGRWADRTASRRACRPLRVLFFFVPLGGVLVFVVFRVDPSLVETIFTTIPDRALAAFRVFDEIVLPRSTFNLDSINERLGALYFQMTFLSETLLAMGGVCAIALTLSRTTLCDIDDDFSISQFWIRVLIFIGSLVFRPAQFSNPNLTANYIDGDGLFVLRESAVIAAGYYYVALMLTDVCGRAVRKFHESPPGRQVTMQARQDNTEH